MPTTPTVAAPRVPPPKVPVPSGPLARWLAHPGSTEARVAHRLAHTLAGLAHFWPLAAVAGVVAAGWWLAAAVTRAWQGRHGRWVAIAPPAEPDPAGGAALWRMLAPLLAARASLTGMRPPVAFECHAGPEGMRIGLWVSATLPLDSVIGAVESAWPGARANLSSAPTLPPRSRVSGGRARLACPDWLPLRTEQGGDSLRGLLGALAVAEGGSVLLQVLARPAPGRQVARAHRAAWARRRGQPTTRAGRVLDLVQHHSAVAGLGGAPDPLALADVRDITAKVTAAPHFVVAVRYALTGPPGPRRQARRWRRAKAREIAAGLGLYAGRNHLVARRIVRGGRGVACRQLRSGFLCSLPEIAALAHLPAEPAGYGLPAAPARHVAPPAEVAHD